MNRKPLAVVALVVLAGGLVLLAAKGPRGFLAMFGVTAGDDRAAPPPPLGADTGDADDASGSAGADRRGAGAERADVLAARRVERRGVGGLLLRVARAGSGAALEGATVLVTGTGHGGEEVRATLLTDRTGSVRFAGLAAGQGYVLRITSISDPVAERPDIEVRAGRDKDLGTVEVGATAGLTGRVVDAEGKPIAGADVRVLAGFENMLELLGNMAELFGTLGREPTPLARGATLDDGTFRLDGLPPGPLVILASAAGKRQTVHPIRMTAKGAAAGAPTIVLEAGGVVAGIVVDAAGAPIAGARLALLETGDNDPSSFLTKRTFTTTGPDGRFRALVDEGAREVRAVVDAQGYPTTFSAQLKPGQEDARIVMIAGASVEVRVEDDAHRAIAGAQVAMGVARGSMNAPDGVGGFLYGSTDETGVVTFTSGPGDVEMVIVNHRDFASAMGSPSRGGGGTPFGLEGEIPKEVKAEGVTRMVVRLRRGLVIRGRVLDSKGSPIPGAEVRTLGGMGFGGGAASRTGADGAYRVTGIAVPAEDGTGGGMGRMSGTMLLVTAPGWIQDEASRAVSTAASKDGEVVHDVTMLAGAVVRGTVVDADGSPFAGAEVRISTEGSFDVLEMMGGSARHATTAVDGTYELRDVAPTSTTPSFVTTPPRATGDGTATETAPEPPRGQARVVVTAADRVSARSEPFAIEAGATIEAPGVKLGMGATLKGRVVEPSGRPAAGASVEVSMNRSAEEWTQSQFSGRNRASIVRTDAEGVFSVRALGKGTGSVVARAKGFAASMTAIKIEDGEPAPVEVRLREAGEIRGRVATPGGAPIAGALVRASAKPGDAVWLDSAMTTSDKDGAFSLKGLPKSTLLLSVTAKGHRSKSVDGTAGGEALDVRLEPRGADDERRREELKKELQDLYTKFATVKDDAERNALIARMGELQREQADLEGSSD